MTLLQTNFSTNSCNPIPECNRNSQILNEEIRISHKLLDLTAFQNPKNPFSDFNDPNNNQLPVDSQVNPQNHASKWRLLRNTVKFIGCVTHPRVQIVDKPQNLNNDFKEFQECLINIQNFKKRTEIGFLKRTHQFVHLPTFPL